MNFKAIQPLLGTGSLLLMSAVALNLAVDASMRSSGELNEQPGAPASKTEDLKAASLPIRGRSRPERYFEAVLERPIFSPQRRPGTMTAAAPIRETRNIQAQTALPSAPPDLLLKGISENGEMRKALIGTESAEIEMEWQKIGTRFDDWELIEIGSDWILIENNEDQIRVDMYK